MQTCIVLANGLLKRIDVYPSGASHSMFLYLGFPNCKIKIIIPSFLLKNAWKMQSKRVVLHFWGISVCAPVHRRGTREMEKRWQLIAFSARAGRTAATALGALAAPLTGAGRGWTSSVIYCCRKMGSLELLLALQGYSGLWWITRIRFKCRLI